jgi:SAM-dependent methyltransferase
MKLNIGCGHDLLDGYVNLDRSDAVGADVVFDLEACKKRKKLPFEDNTFDEIFASHILEHVKNILPLMEELYRVAKPDCHFLIRVPHGGTATAFDDPTHIRQFYPTSFWYFCQPAYARADYHYRADWKVEQIILTVHPRLSEKLERAGIDLSFAIDHLQNIVYEQLAIMTAVKPARPVDTETEPVRPVLQVLTEDGTFPEELIA